MRMAADEFTSTRRVDPILSNDIITEDSAALNFVDQRGDSLRFCHSTGAWFRWNGVFWAKDDTGVAYHWARELARELAEGQDDKTRKITGKTAFADGVEKFAKF